jgi:hypothetical protein
MMPDYKKSVPKLGYALLTESDKDQIFRKVTSQNIQRCIHIELDTGGFYLYERLSDHETVRADPFNRMGNYYFPKDLKELEVLLYLRGWG